ncbi:MAG: hypothetical protein RMJ16_12505 [Thermoguttaceae bacterium]|nr:hypothetical protein [Thermoguttaceae bacterium]
MVEAARRFNRAVHLDTVSRTAPHVRRVIELVREGAIGEVLVAKAWNSQLRANIGRGKSSQPPVNLRRMFDEETGWLPIPLGRDHAGTVYAPPPSVHQLLLFSDKVDRHLVNRYGAKIDRIAH